MSTATLTRPTAKKTATKVRDHQKIVEVTYEDGESFWTRPMAEKNLASFRQGVMAQGAMVTDVECADKCWCQQ